MYVRPDLSFLNHISLIQEKIVFNVLQEYARSGLFEHLYLFNNATIEAILGNVLISEYYSKINNSIVSSFHMVNVFKRVKPIFELNSEVLLPNTKISTVGLYDTSSGTERLYYPLKYITHKTFYYSFPKEELEKNQELLLLIKEQMKNKKNEGMKINFKIFETEYAHPISFCENSTHIIQEQ